MIWNRWRLGSVAVALVLAIAIFPRIANTFLLNEALLRYNLALFSEQKLLNPGMDGYLALTNTDNQGCRDAKAWAEAAMHVYDSVRTRLVLGQIELCSSGDLAALDWVNPVRQNVLVRSQDYSLVMYILSRVGSPEKAIDFYTHIPKKYRLPDQEDAVALAYLRQSKIFNESGAFDDAEFALQQVLQHRPFDIYANLQLLHLIQGGQGDPQLFVERLQSFPIQSILPENTGFIPYITDSIPGLINSGVWDLPMLSNVLDALVWRYPQSVDVERLLNDIRGQFQNAQGLDIDYDLGELYERRGMLPEAANAYASGAELGHLSSTRRLIDICQSHTSICGFQLGKLSTTLDKLISEHWKIASGICLLEKKYGLYCTLMDGEYERGDNPILSIGDTSDGSARQFTLGPDLFPNSSFEIWNDRQNPAGWSVLELNYGPGKGAFAGGRDSLIGIGNRSSVRLMDFWGVKAYSSIGLSPWVENDLQKTTLRPGGQYLLTLTYMTDDDQDVILTLWSSGLFLCNKSRSSSVPEVILPSTRSLWIRVDLPICTPGGSSILKGPAIRLWSSSSVWIDSVYLRQIENAK